MQHRHQGLNHTIVQLIENISQRRKRIRRQLADNSGQRRQNFLRQISDDAQDRPGSIKQSSQRGNQGRQDTLRQIGNDRHSGAHPICKDSNEFKQCRLQLRPFIQKNADHIFQRRGKFFPGISHEIGHFAFQRFDGVRQAAGLLDRGFLNVAALLQYGIEPDLSHCGIIQSINIGTKPQSCGAVLQGRFIEDNSVLIQSIGAAADRALDKRQRFRIVHAERITEVIRQRGRHFREVFGRSSRNAQLVIHGLVGDHETLDFGSTPMHRISVVIRPCGGFLGERSSKLL